jgi:hypothetical protein
MDEAIILNELSMDSSFEIDSYLVELGFVEVSFD